MTDIIQNEKTNPNHPVPKEVLEGLRRHSEQEAAVEARRLEISQLLPHRGGT